MPLVVSVGQASHAGPNGPNQDFAGATTPDENATRSKGVAMVVADGVGKGRGGGALAESSVRAFLSGWYASPETWSPARCLSSLMEERNEHARRDHPGAACTFTAVVIVGRSLHLAHVGDSRVWLVRHREAKQITTDHVWDNPDLRNVVHRAIGLDEQISPQYASCELGIGDVLVLATDGFYKSFDSLRLPVELGTEKDLDACADRLAGLSKANGGDDDATLVVARIEDLPEVGESPLHAEEADLPGLDAPREGLEFDGFRLQKKLGAGRLTEVWLADDREDERRVVIKIPQARAASEKAFREEFLREEWLGKRIQNPGVVPVLALRPGRRTRLYYAMPWTHGTSLRRILSRDGCLDAFAATRMGLEISEALRALHRQGVLHRDIKPDNILREESGRVRLTDLGVARIESLSESDASVPGTPSYMAPELFDGHPATESSEVFALGVTLYECLTRKLPYGEIEPFTRPKFGRPVPPSRWTPGIPPWLESVVLKAVEPDPDRRFQVLSELEIHLERRERVQEQGPIERVDTGMKIRILTAVSIAAMLLALLEAVALLSR